MLLSAIQHVLSGGSSFSVIERQAKAAIQAPSFALPPAGTVVLWRLENRAQALFDLLQAMAQGVVPILVAATTPLGKFRDLSQRFPRLGLYDGRQLVLPSDPVRHPDLFLGFMTSGSTGDPKLVVSTEARVSAGVKAIHEAQGLSGLKRTAVLLPLGYSYASVNQVFWSLAYEAELHLTPGMVMPADTLKILRKFEPEMLCLVNNQLRVLVERGFTEGEPIPSVKVVNFAGAPFPMADFDALKRLFPEARIFNNYGCTEAMPRISACEVHDASQDVTDVGLPIGALQIRIEEPLGRVLFSGPSAALGTLSKEGEIIEAGPWVPSGDLGRLDEAGHLHVLGRGDQVANVAGERLSLIEIEEQLRRAGFVQAVAWVEKQAGEDAIVAVVQGGEALDVKAIQLYLKDHLPRAAWPAWMVRTDEWKLSPNGKSDRKALIAAAKAEGVERFWPPPRLVRRR